MKRIAAVTILTLLISANLVMGGDIGFELTIRGGDQPKQVPAQPVIVLQQQPMLLLSSGLGFQVAVGIPYDMFFISNRYYLYHGDVWYIGATYNGPWTVVKYKSLPPGLQKHKIEHIRTVRDEDYTRYKKKKEHGDDEGGSGHGRGKDKHKKGGHKGKED